MLSASPQSSANLPCQRFDEALDHLYDRILEEEDKILIAEQRKLKKNFRNSSASFSSHEEEEELDVEIDGYNTDSDDLSNVSSDSDDDGML